MKFKINFSCLLTFHIVLTTVDVCFRINLSPLVFSCILFDAFDNFYTISCTYCTCTVANFILLTLTLTIFLLKIQKKITYFMVVFGVTTFFTIKHCFIAILLAFPCPPSLSFDMLHRTGVALCSQIWS